MQPTGSEQFGRLDDERRNLGRVLRIAQEETAHRDPFEDQRQGADHDGRLAQRGISHERAVAVEQIDQGRSGRAADAFDGEARGSRPESVLRQVQTFGRIQDHDVAAKRFQLIDNFRSADQIDRLEATRFGKGDDRATDARIGGILDDPVAGREVDELTQQQPSGRRIDGQHGELLRIDAGGQCEQPFRWHDDPLGPREAIERRQDAIADSDIVDARTYGQYPADALVANHARQAWAKGVGAADHQQVAEIDRGEFDAYQNLAGAWRGGFLNLHEFETLGGIAESGEVNGAHGTFLLALAGRLSYGCDHHHYILDGTRNL